MHETPIDTKRSNYIKCIICNHILNCKKLFAASFDSSAGPLRTSEKLLSVGFQNQIASDWRQAQTLKNALEEQIAKA